MNALPFSLAPQQLARRLADFHDRREIVALGLQGRFESPGTAQVKFLRLEPAYLGGAGQQALNGGLIATGFDAACVLATLGHTDVDLLATLTLQIQYLRVATASPGLVFCADVLKAARSVVFVQAELVDRSRPGQGPLAVASATLAPLRSRSAAAVRQGAEPLLAQH